MPTEHLEHFVDDDIERVLCVVAHPDDIEYGTSSAVAVWTQRGIDVTYLLLTRGEAGINSMPPAQTGALREREQRAAGEAVGVSHIDFLNYPDGALVYSLDMRRDIARVVRRQRPDVVVTQTWAEEPGWGLNKADHRAVGLATADAVRDAANRWAFTELVDEGLKPWSAHWLLVAQDPRPTHGVDITGEPLERGIASLAAHQEYFAALADHPSARDLLTGMAESAGQHLGVTHATLFRAHKLG